MNIKKKKWVFCIRTVLDLHKNFKDSRIFTPFPLLLAYISKVRLLQWMSHITWRICTINMIYGCWCTWSSGCWSVFFITESLYFPQSLYCLLWREVTILRYTSAVGNHVLPPLWWSIFINYLEFFWLRNSSFYSFICISKNA